MNPVSCRQIMTYSLDSAKHASLGSSFPSACPVEVVSSCSVYSETKFSLVARSSSTFGPVDRAQEQIDSVDV